MFLSGYLQEDVSDIPPAKYPVRLRLDSVTPDPTSTAAPSASDQLTILAEDLSLQFKMSGLNCLSDFAEDEKISSDTLPMSLDVRNLLLVLEVGFGGRGRERVSERERERERES